VCGGIDANVDSPAPRTNAPLRSRVARPCDLVDHARPTLREQRLAASRPVLRAHCLAHVNAERWVASSVPRARNARRTRCSCAGPEARADAFSSRSAVIPPSSRSYITALFSKAGVFSCARNWHVEEIIVCIALPAPRVRRHCVRSYPWRAEQARRCLIVVLASCALRPV
jgi:hypothetical protein